MATIEEAQEILEALGMPPAQTNRMSGLTLLALCGLEPDDPWSVASRTACTVTKSIMSHVTEHYGIEYAPNTRETFRRQVLHQFIQGGIADYNPFEPDLPTNSPRAHYAITKAALTAVREYCGERWPSARTIFLREQGSLAERYARDRDRAMIPVTVGDGNELRLSPGKHNELQKAIVERFAPRFAPGAQLLYLGDTAKKDLFVDGVALQRLGIPINDRDKLPDVVLYDAERDWLFLVEAVTSHGPVSPKRVVELEEMLAACPAGVVYVSAFPDFREFQKHLKDISWETEVWVCEVPDHMIHYDGDRYLGPRK